MNKNLFCFLLFTFIFVQLFGQSSFSIEHQNNNSGSVLFNFYHNDKLIISQTSGLIILDTMQNVEEIDFSYISLSPNLVEIENKYYYTGYASDLKSRMIIKLDADFDTIQTKSTSSQIDSALYFGYNFVASIDNKIIELATLQDRSLTSGDYIWTPEWVVYDTNFQVLDILDFNNDRELIALNSKVVNEILYVPYKEIIKEGDETAKFGILKINSSLEIVDDLFLYYGNRTGYSLFQFEILDSGDIIYHERGKDRRSISRINGDGDLVWEKEFEKRYFTDQVNLYGITKVSDGVLVAGSMFISSKWRKPFNPRNFYTAWVAKIGLDGKYLWQHYITNTENSISLSSNLSGITIGNNNSIFLSGFIESHLGELDRTWILKLNENGCLNGENCDFDIHVSENQELVDTCEFIFEQPTWYYRVASPDCNIKVNVSVIGDTLIGFQLASILGVIREDTLVTASEVIVSKEVGRVHFYEDNEWWLAYDLSNEITYWDTMEYYIPYNASRYRANNFNNDDSVFYRGPYYSELRNGLNPVSYDDSTFSKNYFTEDLTNYVTGNSFGRYLGSVWTNIGPELSLFGELGTPVGNPCRARLGCFTNNRFTHEFLDGVCHLVTQNHETILEEDLSIYPNPTSGEVYFKNHKVKHFELYNLSGSIIISGMVSGRSIDIQELPSDLYILKGYDINKNVVLLEKLVKI